MVDNVELNSGSGGATVAADDIGGIHHQRVKVQHGADGSATDVSSASPLPVTAADGAVASLSSSYTVILKSNILSLSSSYTVAAIKAALPAGTNNIGDVDVLSLPAITLSSSYTMIAVGRAAHGAAVAGNPLLAGLEARTTNPTAVDNGDAVRAMADDLGRQIVTLHQARDLVTEAHLTSMSASTTQTLLAAGAAGVFHDLTSIILSNFSATVANVIIYDGVAAGTARFRFDLAADGGGAVINFTHPFRQAAAATAWAIKSTELDVAVTVQAVKNV